jgi:hypothetical protein
MIPMPRSIWLAFLVVPCSLLAACGDSDSDGEGDDDPNDGACNSLSNDASTVQTMLVAETMPNMPQGGTLAEGAYHLTARTRYTGPGGMTGTAENRKQAISLKATGVGSYDLESVLSDDGGPDEHVSLAVTVSGFTASSDVTCPFEGFFAASGFTATATSYTVFDSLDGEVSVYTLVP